MARQQRDFACDDAKPRSAATTWLNGRSQFRRRACRGAQTRQYFIDAAAKIQIDGPAGGIAENRDRFRIAWARLLDRKRHVGQGAGGETARAIKCCESL
jgi:hypothetical protein